MARTPEQIAWDNLSPALKSLTPCVDRIESTGTGTGTPDIAYSWQHGHGWIELKADAKCLTVGDRVNLKHYTPVQRTWMRRRAAKGPNCWLMIRTVHGWYAVPGSLAWTLEANPTHEQILKRNARYLPESSVTHQWLRQFL